MGYTGGAYIICFLILTMFLYQIMPQRFRWLVILAVNILFLASYNVRGSVIVVAVTMAAWLEGMAMHMVQKRHSARLAEMGRDVPREDKKKYKAACQSRQRAVLAVGIISVIGILIVCKYYNFIVWNVNSLIYRLGGTHFMEGRDILSTIGISYFVLQSVSYMADVYWNKTEAVRNPLKVMMYLSFFPTLVQGPIALITDIRDELYAGAPLSIDNIERGYIRIIWGTFKKIVIADRLNAAVATLYDASNPRTGIYIVAAAVFFTVQEYMDFSGCVDIAIGSAEIFGIHLPENFRQPFKSRDASEFWRRWHITLGTFFKTYIFYPVSVSPLAKRWNRFGKDRLNPYLTRLGVMAMALLPVWLANGIWHGPQWNYIFYGIFYFVIIMFELAMTPVWQKLRKLIHLSDESGIVVLIQIARTWIVIFTGELLFRAENLGEGFAMLRRMFTDFQLSAVWNGSFLELGIGMADYKAVILGIVAVAIVGYMKERGIDIRQRILESKLPVRWGIILVLIAVVIIMGQYGPGYRKTDFIYAGF